MHADLESGTARRLVIGAARFQPLARGSGKPLAPVPGPTMETALENAGNDPSTRALHYWAATGPDSASSSAASSRHPSAPFSAAFWRSQETFAFRTGACREDPHEKEGFPGCHSIL